MLAGAGSNAIARAFDWADLSAEVQPGDVVVSMLPANLHHQVSTICMEKKAHFVSSSYLSPEMLALDKPARAANLSFLNEVGLDPGIDHLLAHALMAEYQSSPVFDKNNEHSFRSYCGGLPKTINDFRYKFSWSPLGVLRALKSSSQWIAEGETRTGDRPWKTVSNYRINLPSGDENFEAFPNRDSLPFLDAYGFGDDWNIKEFVRGTLRYDGWCSAWSDIFELVEAELGDPEERKLREKSEELWSKYQYDKGEADRVVLVVELEVEKDGETIWHKRNSMDEVGNDRGSAMSRLVSLPVSLGVEAVLDGKIASGVSPAPNDQTIVNHWLEQLSNLGESIHKTSLT
jgi:saccharopine dehydrogenase (NADP+, L-glutamate forming)